MKHFLCTLLVVAQVFCTTAFAKPHKANVPSAERIAATYNNSVTRFKTWRKLIVFLKNHSPKEEGPIFDEIAKKFDPKDEIPKGEVKGNKIFFSNLEMSVVDATKMEFLLGGQRWKLDSDATFAQNFLRALKVSSPKKVYFDFSLISQAKAQVGFDTQKAIEDIRGAMSDLISGVMGATLSVGFVLGTLACAVRFSVCRTIIAVAALVGIGSHLVYGAEPEKLTDLKCFDESVSGNTLTATYQTTDGKKMTVQINKDPQRNNKPVVGITQIDDKEVGRIFTDVNDGNLISTRSTGAEVTPEEMDSILLRFKALLSICEVPELREQTKKDIREGRVVRPGQPSPGPTGTGVR